MLWMQVPACALAMSVATGCVAFERVSDVAPTNVADPQTSKTGLVTDAGAELPVIEYVQIPGGAFTMGSPSDEEDRNDNEGPQHAVSVAAFALAKYEITNAEYGQFLDAHPDVMKPQNWAFWLPSDVPAAIEEWGELPVTGMNWDEAVLFATWVGARLPTEAEWEYAARAGTTGSRYGELDDVAWYLDNARGVARAVGTKQSNAWGLYDMLGNVHEWCGDVFAVYQAEPSADPQVMMQGASHGVRGGSFADPKKFSRAAARLSRAPDKRSGDWGFRVVRLEGQGQQLP